MAVVGLISDTHGLLRPAAVRALVGSDLIIHAGDVGSPAAVEGCKHTLEITVPSEEMESETRRGGGQGLDHSPAFCRRHPEAGAGEPHPQIPAR